MLDLVFQGAESSEFTGFISLLVWILAEAEIQVVSYNLKKKRENPSSVGMIIKHLNLQQIRLFPDTFNHCKV